MTVDSLVVASLDVYEPPVAAILARRIPAAWSLHQAASYDPAEQTRTVAEADVILCGWAPVPAALIEAAPRLRFIQKLGIGTDKVDLDEAQRRGVRVAIAAGINAAPVAEMAVLLTLSVLRRLLWAVAEVRGGRFPKTELRSTALTLRGKRVGLIGFGHIGRKAASLFRAFEAEVIYFDPRRADEATEIALGAQYVELDELVHRSDVISLHVPLTDHTRHLLDADRLGQMPSGAIVVNTARGGLIDETALVSLIRRGHLAGAGLDVTEVEPLPTDSPLLATDGIVVTPHSAGAVLDNFPVVVDHALANVERFVGGQSLPPEDVVL